ncbi:hypothetical protein BBOV_III002010 [Babesia bovis T2Bo]|uniref:Uncharacterized protein n=1 Tax=Babesia bovis TaxID=5865 RepID=A7AMI4_BABBO|nr:hypothetical protein BBOV_III002010 [Babesia bovis T2Bo]EDO07768.1 hypothetical protein BBOV_III002010 [Babesia bovis T2Bo]|eukprot:XP_001611336.1 hypothetical protein [Babesia bovis T2Bo]
MNNDLRYRVILHGPSVWKGTTKPVDAEQETPFIVAFEPQSNLVIVKQGTVEIENLTIDDLTSATQILSLFFFESQDDANDAERVLNKSLSRLQTLYDIFRNTTILEVLERCLGSVHVPLEVVSSRMDFNAEASIVSNGGTNSARTSDVTGAYNLRMPISQNLQVVTPDMDMIEYLKQALGKKNHIVNKVSISFYQTNANKLKNDSQLSNEVGATYVVRKSALNTPRNVTRATTPSARAGKAVVDLYSKRGLINPPTQWSASEYDENILAAASPVLKGAITSQKLEECIGELRSVSQEQYVALEELDNAEIPQNEVVNTESLSIDNDEKSVKNVKENKEIITDGLYTDRTNNTEIDAAVEFALQLIHTFDLGKIEVLNVPEPDKPMPQVSRRNLNVADVEEKVENVENEDHELLESTEQHITEISQPCSPVIGEEQSLEEELMALKSQHELETIELNSALKEKEEQIQKLVNANLAKETETLSEHNKVVDNLKQQINGLLAEKQNLSRQLQTIVQENQQLGEQVDIYEGKLADAKKLEVVIEQIKTESEGKLTVLRECLAKQQKDNELLNSEVNRCNAEISNITTAFEEVKQRETMLIAKTNEYKKELKQLDVMQVDLDSANEQIEQLKNEISKLKMTNEEQKQLFADSEMRCEKLKEELDLALAETSEYKQELNKVELVSLQLKESLDELKAKNNKLEVKLEMITTLQERLKTEKNNSTDQILKEKMKYDILMKEYEVKCSNMSEQIACLQNKLNVATEDYEALRNEYASHRIKCCLDSSIKNAKLVSGAKLKTSLMNTVLKCKAELARQQCQLKVMAKTLKLPDNVKTTQIAAEVGRNLTVLSIAKHKLATHGKIKAAYNHIKAEKDDLMRQLETKKYECKSCAKRNEHMIEENQRLISALMMEREKLASMQIEAKLQIANELTKTNEEKRILYAKQCELKMQNEDLKEEVSVLKRQVTMLQMSSIERESDYKESPYPSIDSNNLVVHKLNSMPNVFPKTGMVHRSMRRGSETTFCGDVSVDYTPSVDFGKQRTLDRNVIPGSPCAYKDTKASLYSRRATLERMRAREHKFARANDEVYVGSSIKHKHPWMF